MGLSRLTGVVAECVQDGDEVVQAGPVVRVAVKALLEGMPRQGDSHQLHGHLPDLIPHVDVGGVQHHGLEEGFISDTGVLFDQIDKDCIQKNNNNNNNNDISIFFFLLYLQVELHGRLQIVTQSSQAGQVFEGGVLQHQPGVLGPHVLVLRGLGLKYSQLTVSYLL